MYIKLTKVQKLCKKILSQESEDLNKNVRKTSQQNLMQLDRECLFTKVIRVWSK